MAADFHQMTEQPSGTQTIFLEGRQRPGLLPRLLRLGNLRPPHHPQSTTTQDRLPQCQQERTTRFLVAPNVANETQES